MALILITKESLQYYHFKFLIKVFGSCSTSSWIHILPYCHSVSYSVILLLFYRLYIYYISVQPGIKFPPVFPNRVSNHRGCTDRKALCGKFVILGNMNKTNLTCYFSETSEINESSPLTPSQRLHFIVIKVLVLSEQHSKTLK